MHYLLYKLDTNKAPLLTLSSGKVGVPLFEIAANPMIPLADLKKRTEPERAAILRNAFALAQRDLAERLWTCALEIKRAHPGAPYLVLLVSQKVECLSADEVEHPIYDPPMEWDDEEQEMVVPEGAKVVGYTNATLGWVLSTKVGLTAVPELPAEFAEEDASDEFPFWVRPASVPKDTMAYFLTPKGRRQFAMSMGVQLGYGPAPTGALTPAELLQE